MLAGEDKAGKESAIDLEPGSALPAETLAEAEEPDQFSETASQFISPLSQPEERIRLKRFSDYITPENSPVSPERFRGYHTGVDFEVFPEELNSAVAVKAGCSGAILLKQWVSGYGGTVVMGCEIESETVTVLYGHLNLGSISAKVGDTLATGEVIGYLGADNSQDTDRERKHLHLSIHQGKTVNLLDYVNSEAEVKGWLNPCDYICN